MTLYDTVIFKHPVLRVNNRDENIDFYRKTLGLRLVSEENAIAIFSAWNNPQASFIIEESPAMRTRAVEGAKKLNHITIKASSSSEIEALLGNGAVAKTIFKGKNGYAFEAISPEGDAFLIHAEDDKSSLTEVVDVDFSEQIDVKGLSDFSYDSITFNVPDIEQSQSFYQLLLDGFFPVDLNFLPAQGEDLRVEPNVTWDLEILEYQVPNHYDLSELKTTLEAKGQSVYLDKKETVLVLSDPSRIEVWFSKC